MCYIDKGSEVYRLSQFPIVFKSRRFPMNSLFAFAIGVRLVAFIVFVACVYAGNLLFIKLEQRQSKLLWKISFVTLYSLFLLLVTYVVWLVFYFGLNA